MAETQRGFCEALNCVHSARQSQFPSPILEIQTYINRRRLILRGKGTEYGKSARRSLSVLAPTAAAGLVQGHEVLQASELRFDQRLLGAIQRALRVEYHQ